MKIKVNEIGAELKSLIVDDVEYMWSSDPKYWKRSAPFLFPIVGSLINNKTLIEGKEYELLQHGFLRDQLFNVERKNNEVICKNKYSEETLKRYPYKYQATIKYEINDYSLKTIINIKNIDDKNIYFNLGGHPAFNCPIYPNEKFNDYRICFEKEENIESPKVLKGGILDFNNVVYENKHVKELKLDKALFDIDTILIKNVKSKTVKLLNKNNQGIELSYPAFSTLAIWTPFNDAPFICLEPWIGYNDQINSNHKYEEKDDIVKLKPQQSYEVYYEIKIIK